MQLYLQSPRCVHGMKQCGGALRCSSTHNRCTVKGLQVGPSGSSDPMVCFWPWSWEAHLGLGTSWLSWLEGSAGLCLMAHSASCFLYQPPETAQYCKGDRNWVVVRQGRGWWLICCHWRMGLCSHGPSFGPARPPKPHQ